MLLSLDAVPCGEGVVVGRRGYGGEGADRTSLPPPLSHTPQREDSSPPWEGVGPCGEGGELQGEGPGKTMIFSWEGFNSNRAIIQVGCTCPW